MVIIGGIRRIAIVAASIVPLMGIFYALGAVAVAISNADQILPSLAAVFADAFTGSAASGGFLGATFAYAFNRGVNRGLFSNEAGQGSAPMRPPERRSPSRRAWCRSWSRSSTRCSSAPSPGW